MYFFKYGLAMSKDLNASFTLANLGERRRKKKHFCQYYPTKELFIYSL